MATYAQVQNGVVVNCIVADATFIGSLPNSDEFHWYDESRPVGIGWTWSTEHNRAIPPQPYPSWTLNGWLWVAPVPKPDGDYTWDEDAQDWVAF